MSRKYPFLFLIICPIVLNAQCFLTGSDLSYTNEILRNGGAYNNELGEEVDPYEYFAERGNKIVRLRLWHTPENNTDVCGNQIKACGLEDVLDAAAKVKSNGMQLKLSIHYSDYFADPGKQPMPKAWEGLSHPDLLDSISNYTTMVLKKLMAQNTLPEIVSVGNETTWGFIDNSATTDGFDWGVDADKYNVALSAIDDFNQEHNTHIKKAIHLTESSAIWAAAEFDTNGVNNFDMIGISYYPFFSPNVSMEEVGEMINNLHTDYGKEIMVFETGFAWSDGYVDNYNNFITNNGDMISYSMTAQGQKYFLLDLAETVDQNKGTGLIYWEPTWITSDLCDKWGQGSSYENVSIYNFENNQPLESFEFFKYCSTSTDKIAGFEYEIIVYPNPSISSELKIHNAPVKWSWALLDTSGKEILKGVFKNKNEIINLKDIRKGVYFLSIFQASSEERILKKILIK